MIAFDEVFVGFGVCVIVDAYLIALCSVGCCQFSLGFTRSVLGFLRTAVCGTEDWNRFCL